jgi:hypothetical protein
VPSAPYLEASDEGLVRLRGGKPRRGVWDRKDKKFRIVVKKAGAFLIHRLVCEAFHGPAPEGKPYALHRDEDGANNRPENLYWGTQKENLNAPGFLAYCRARIGDQSPRRKGLMR